MSSSEDDLDAALVGKSSSFMNFDGDNTTPENPKYPVVEHSGQK